MFLIMLMFLIGLPSLFAQEKITVKGTIVDNAGEPMVGVTVQEVGNTANGTLTDLNGIFQFTVTKGSSLRFSYIGYKQTERKATSDKMTITLMEDKKLLDEVVVVGYGVQKKSSLTGAVSQVKSEDMISRTITSPQQALEGKTSGVQVLSSSSAPGSSPSVRIRGVSSNGSSAPLFIVDGRIASDVSGIDPNDIESMEVLKDASSAAIYGAQAGNGVVLITTKRGKGNGKITYEYQWTSQSINKVPKVMNSEEYIDYYTAAGMTDLKSIYNFWDGKTNTDWTDVAFENSRMTRHNVTFQRGDENGSLYASMTYLNNDGPIVGKADSYSRITGMLNATYKIKPWLELVTNNQIESYHVRSVAEGSEYSSLLLAALQLDPLTKPTYTVNDMPDNMSAILANSSYGELLSDGNGNYYGVSPFVSENLNPLIMRDRSYSKTHGFNLNGSTSLNFKPIQGFCIHFTNIL
jgi:TonB-linked SusC/RagA family outer membrane protein